MENGDWKFLMWDTNDERPRMPGGSVGHRWGEEKGKWNLKLEDAEDGSAINPELTFLDRNNERVHPYGTSWGFSTRMVGATIMAHGDDSGLVLPPNVAPTQVVIVPIFRKEEDRVAVAAAIEKVQAALADVQTASGPLRLKVDWREETPGCKYNHWELRGVPYRLEIGPRDVANESAMLVRRLDRAKCRYRLACAF